jgi:hypothetical protein
MYFKDPTIEDGAMLTIPLQTASEEAPGWILKKTKQLIGSPAVEEMSEDMTMSKTRVTNL